MDFIEILGLGLILGPIKELVDSMHQSKTLTLMVVVGLTFMIGFALFLVKIAEMQ
ncbi:hypothetical protein [uncultured Shewanella sp.]|uniref:hypothetical protein n=1 Tax=uncultured Shewanella sp. TaxID=173975 RepID=UPI0026290CD6|nr:hypothetical protein [uncultured Shewanella sp.]